MVESHKTDSLLGGTIQLGSILSNDLFVRSTPHRGDIAHAMGAWTHELLKQTCLVQKFRESHALFERTAFSAVLCASSELKASGREINVLPLHPVHPVDPV